VALIGIDRSIAAGGMMQLSLPERVESIVPMILQLDGLRDPVGNEVFHWRATSSDRV
jgi:hypothetical protein